MNDALKKVISRKRLKRYDKRLFEAVIKLTAQLNAYPCRESCEHFHEVKNCIGCGNKQAVDEAKELIDEIIQTEKPKALNPKGGAA